MHAVKEQLYVMYVGVCAYVNVCVCVCMCDFVHLSLFACANRYIKAFLCVCVCVCVRKEKDRYNI